MPVPGRRKRADSRYAERARDLSARLRARREQAGLTQEQLASRAGLSAATIRKIETGAVAEPGWFTVLDIARALGVDLRDVGG